MILNRVAELRELGERLDADVKKAGTDSAKRALQLWKSQSDFLAKEDCWELAQEDTLSADAFRDALADIGRAYLPNSDFLPDDAETGLRWCSLAAEMGSLMAQLVLVQNERISQGRVDAAFAKRVFLRWQAVAADEQSLRQQTSRFASIRTLAAEVGLCAAIANRDPEIAEETLKLMAELGVDEPALLGLRWEAQNLLGVEDSIDGVRILQDLVPSTEQREKEQIRRMKPLLEPLPLASWPKSDDWAETLRAEFPNLQEVIDRLLGSSARARYLNQRELQFSPILLVGGAGIGKSRFCRRLAGELGVPSRLYSLNGMNDNMLLKGNARGWAGARPGALLEYFLKAKIANPLVCLDEIDKIGEGRQNGRVWDTLLGMLEPATASQVLDEFMLTPVDYSRINWIATANDIRMLPDPLKSRFRVIYVRILLIVGGHSADRGHPPKSELSGRCYCMPGCPRWVNFGWSWCPGMYVTVTV